MPIVTPGRCWQPALMLFMRETPGYRLLALLEQSIKGPLNMG